MNDVLENSDTSLLFSSVTIHNSVHFYAQLAAENLTRPSINAAHFPALRTGRPMQQLYFILTHHSCKFQSGTCDLFIAYIATLLQPSNGRINVRDELEGTWKETSMTYFSPVSFLKEIRWAYGIRILGGLCACLSFPVSALEQADHFSRNFVRILCHYRPPEPCTF
jgi:hypothetical protein